MNKTLLSVVLLPLCFGGCQKDPVTVPDPQPPKADAVDSLIGTYIGSVMEINVYYSAVPPPGTSNPKVDTTYYTDTIFITKFSADTIKLENEDWYYGRLTSKKGLFAYDTSNHYQNYDAPGNYVSVLNMDVVPNADSVYLYGQTGVYYNWHQEKKRYFSGKR